MAVLEQTSTTKRAARRSREGVLVLFREPGGLQLALGMVLIVVAVALPDALGMVYLTGVMQIAVAYVVASIFMGLLLVDAGQVSFGHGAVFGAAAYAVAIACSLHGQPYIVGVFFGALAALAVGVLFALPALRVQWFYLGFATMSAGMVFPDMLFAFDKYTNGLNGISLPFTELRRPFLGNLSLLSVLVMALGVAALATSTMFPRTVLGRRMRVAAASSEAARSLGINPGIMRFAAFLIASFGTGLAGVLYPPIVGFVSPNAFHLDLSILFFFAVIVGGKGQPLGTLVGVALLYLLPNVLLASFSEVRTLIYGLVAFVIMIAMPNGVIGSLVKWRRAQRPAPKIEPVSFASLNRIAPIGGARREQSVIEIADLTKRFGNVTALNGVSLTVQRGEIHGIVGANGSGKTSLLNVLSGFQSQQSGSARILGHDIAGMSASRIASLGVGRTFQTPRIFDQMTAWENVQIGLDAQWSGKPRRIPEDFVRELQASLEGREAELIPHGLRRLIEISRVILREPELLLLDEPAAGLSPDERISFANLLRDLRDKLGLTIVFVEHDLDLVARVADRVTVLEGGSVIASGKLDSVWNDPRIRPLFLTTNHA